jgi:DNA-binding HxlR family transcriptional regulator
LSNLILIHRILRLVQPKLTVEAVTALAESPQRYTDLVRIITVVTDETVHPRTLIDTLRKLQDNGIVDHNTVDDDDGPVYRLTRNGHELVRLLSNIERWGQDYTDSLDE